MKKHTRRLFCWFLQINVHTGYAWVHSLIMVKIKLMTEYIFPLDKSFSSLLKFYTICIVHGF